MAVLILEDGTTITALADIAAAVAPLGVGLARWEIEGDALAALLAQDVLSDDDGAQVLDLLDHRFKALEAEQGYRACDLVVLHAAMPTIDALSAKFYQAHTHDDDEVRYIVDGEGTFGFVLPGGAQAEVTITAGDYVNVPAGTEHWFHLTASKRIKAVRYFTDSAGWKANFTGTGIRLKPAV